MNPVRMHMIVIRVEDVDGFIYPVVGIFFHGADGFPYPSRHLMHGCIGIHLLPVTYFNKLAAGATLAVGGYEDHAEMIAGGQFLHYIRTENNSFHAVKLHINKL